LEGVLFAILPEFDTIDDVLPENVAACTYGGYRIKIGIGHPDAEGGILLERGLATIDLIAQMTTYATPQEEEHKAENKAENGDE
jgi:hypothetical protein